MASQILSGTPATLAVDDPVLANPVVAQGVGGGGFVAEWDGTTGVDGAFNVGYVAVQAGSGNSAGNDLVQFLGGADPAAQGLRFAIGTGGKEAGANSGNNFSVFSYDDTSTYSGNPLLITRADQRVLLNPGFSAGQCGIATIPTGQQTVAVALPAVTASSVIICSPTGAPDTVADYVKGVTINPGVGFTIAVNANVLGAGWSIAWFVAKF